MCLFGKYGLSDNFFVIHANLYYRHLLVLCFVIKSCILLAVSSADVCEFIKSQVKKQILLKLPLNANTYLYIIQNNIFCTFPEVAIVRCSRKYLF